MDFTREPIIETIVTPKDGYKLVVRSSKGTAQEEYFVDAVEIVSFGQALFFRSLERPKSFLVPVADYEILEVREARMVLKNAGLDRSIKIGGGREGALKATREVEKEEAVEEVEPVVEQEEVQAPAENVPAKAEVRLDKKRDRRRNYRKKRGAKGEEREEAPKEEAVEPSIPSLEDGKINIPPPEVEAESKAGVAAPLSSNLLSSLLQPPPTLISETINRYRENALFKNAFFLTEEEQYKPHDKVQDLLNEDDEEDFAPPLQEPTYVTDEGQSEQPEGSQQAETLAEDQAELFEEKTWEEAVQSEDVEQQEASLSLYAEEDESAIKAFSEEEQQEEVNQAPSEEEVREHQPHNNL